MAERALRVPGWCRAHHCPPGPGVRCAGWESNPRTFRLRGGCSSAELPAPERKVKESNPRALPRPGFQDQLPTAGRHLPWSGWPDSNRRPLRTERSALTKLRHNPLVGDGPVEWSRTTFLRFIRAAPLPRGPRRDRRRVRGSNPRRCHPGRGLASRPIPALATLQRDDDVRTWSRSRTCNTPGLSRWPLPIGLPRRAWSRPDSNRRQARRRLRVASPVSAPLPGFEPSLRRSERRVLPNRRQGNAGASEAVCCARESNPHWAGFGPAASTVGLPQR